MKLRRDFLGRGIAGLVAVFVWPRPAPARATDMNDEDEALDAQAQGHSPFLAAKVAEWRKIHGRSPFRSNESLFPNDFVESWIHRAKASEDQLAKYLRDQQK